MRSRCPIRGRSPEALTSEPPGGPVGRGALVRVLLSTIGSRGDVQPLVALASQLSALGQDVRLCVPPDFQEWIDGLGFPVTPIGPELRQLTAAGAPATPAPPSAERRRQLAEAS